MLVHELVHSGLGNGHGFAVSVVNDLFALTLALGARGFDDLIGLGLGVGALTLSKRGGFLAALSRWAVSSLSRAATRSSALLTFSSASRSLAAASSSIA